MITTTMITTTMITTTTWQILAHPNSLSTMPRTLGWWQTGDFKQQLVTTTIMIKTTNNTNMTDSLSTLPWTPGRRQTGDTTCHNTIVKWHWQLWHKNKSTTKPKQTSQFSFHSALNPCWSMADRWLYATTNMITTTGDTTTFHSNNYAMNNQISNIVKLAIMTSKQNHNNNKTESHYDCYNDIIRDTNPPHDIHCIQ